MIKLLPGDFFCTKNPMMLGKAIRIFERFRDGGHPEYSHSGIITDSDGNTLEALWTVKGNSLDAYKGEKVIIGRWKGMTPDALEKGFEFIGPEIHEIYPGWRLLLMAIPSAARYISTGNWTVCSELLCKFLVGSGMVKIDHWQDRDPQFVANMILQDSDVQKVYEDTWPI